MPVIAFVSGKAAPGVTTTVCALASVWPRAVLVADCDPAGGDVLAGWLSPWLAEGWLRTDVGLLSFTTSTRHAGRATRECLRPHVQHVYAAPRVWLLVGVRDGAQSSSLGEPGWARLAEALTEMSADTDVLVDCGRIGPASPWPVLAAAGALLVVAQPTFRGVAGARAAVRALDRRVDPTGVGLLTCATTSATRTAREAARALELPLVAAPRGLTRSPLVRSARSAAERLLAHQPQVEQPLVSGGSEGSAPRVGMPG